jgi:hypothetical protein
MRAQSLVGVAAMSLSVMVTAGLIAVGPAAAELQMIPGSATPSTITFPGPGALVYTLQLKADGRDETFALQFRGPFFGRDPTGTSPIGGSLSFAGERPIIDGPARLLGPASATLGFVACGPGVFAHSFDVERRSWDVLVPAGTTSTVSLDFRAGSSSPWPDTSYDATFNAVPRLSTGGQGSLDAPQTVTVRGPRTSGTRGVHMTLRSTPKTRLAGLRPLARVRRGKRIVIRGTTSPHRLGKNISLWTLTGRQHRYRFTRRVRTDRHGRFRTTFRAQRSFAVMARIPASRGFSADYTCPLAFDVRS